MANLSSNVKTAFLKGLDALSKTASNLSGAAQQKLSEMNLETRRRELLSEIPKCVMQLWKDGVEMPQELTALLSELTALEEKLSAMRPQPRPEAGATQETPEETQPEPDDEPNDEPGEEPAAPQEQPCACDGEPGAAEDEPTE